MGIEAPTPLRTLIPEGHICTYSGKAVDPVNFREDDIELVDVAHALSLVCRFNGHVRFHYSVAQHSTLGVLWMQTKDVVAGHDSLTVQRWFALHDAAEAYICDMPRPIKRQPGVRELFKRIEDNILEKFANRFDLPPIQTVQASVDAVDLRMLYTEKRDCHGTPEAVWPSLSVPDPAPYPSKVQPRTPEQVKAEYLDMLGSLGIS